MRLERGQYIERANNQSRGNLRTPIRKPSEDNLIRVYDTVNQSQSHDTYQPRVLKKDVKA